MRSRFITIVTIALCYTATQAQLFKSKDKEVKPIIPENAYQIVPQPASLTPLKGKFHLLENGKIVFDGRIKDYKFAPPYLLSVLNPATGYKYTFDKMQQGDSPGKNDISFVYDKTITNREAYNLEVKDDRVIVKCSGGAGAFYAIQTLLQLMDDSIYYQKKILGKIWTIPCVTIQDAPRFGYRGMHLDCARHLFPVSFVKKYIDMMAMHKMNTFHWHLTDDQGWRIEIKKYPKLTTVGAFRKGTFQYTSHDLPPVFDKTPYGGFYTQADIKAIVKYAQERYVTIIPEIEMPGHALAALASYPEYACKDTVIEVGTNWGVYDEAFCPTEKTFTFLQDILNEVTLLFPGKYVHIGGDEVLKSRWKESTACQDLMKREKLKDENELQSYFIKRIEKYLVTKQKQIIGWDEILDGGLSPNATVMSWRGEEGGVAAAKQNHDAIMTPGNFCYFDHYQSLSPSEPFAGCCYVPVSQVYSYDPIPKGLNETEAAHILGAQGNVWTEYMNNSNYVEYMIMPRQCALAEALWTPKEKMNYADFSSRMVRHFNRFNILKINYAKHMMDVSAKINSTAGKVSVELSSVIPDAKIYYTSDGSAVTPGSTTYTEAVTISKSGVFKAANFKDGSKIGNDYVQQFNMHKAAGVDIKLTNQPSSTYNPGGAYFLLNGVEGSSNYGDGQWLGFSGVNFDAVIDLGSDVDVSGIKINYIVKNDSWIYAPVKITYSVSTDGVNYKEVYNGVPDASNGLKNAAAKFATEKARYIKVLAENTMIIAGGNAGAGNPAWLFVDEVVVE
ncbi:MAG: family 20 glycosylhydrolase [Bacteroidia bacterium]